MRRFLTLAAAVLVGATAAPVTAQAAGPARGGKAYVKVGYFTQWGIYGRDFQLAKVDRSGAAARLTHLNYAFGPVTAEGVCASADAWADWQTPFPAAQSVDGVGDVEGQPLAGNLNQLAELKAKHRKLRVLISLGGWTGSAYFSDAARTDASRRKLVRSCVDLWLKGNLPGLPAGTAAGIFDGIDLDWEWPGSSGNDGNVIRPEDKRNFTLLTAEFRKQLDALGRSNRRHYDLTAFVPAAPAKIDAGFEVRPVFRHLDFATVQGYDFHGSWENRTNQQSALRVPRGAPDNPDFSVEVAIDAYRSRGARADQLVLGIPYYGQGWTGVTPAAPAVLPRSAAPPLTVPAPVVPAPPVAAPGDGLFWAATGGAPGTHAVGTEDYKVLKNLQAQGYTLHRDWRAGHSWLFDGTTFWTYDDPAQILQKTAWIRARGLGGAMMWSLDGDDANATLTRTVSAGLSSF